MYTLALSNLSLLTILLSEFFVLGNLLWSNCLAATLHRTEKVTHTHFTGTNLLVGVDTIVKSALAACSLLNSYMQVNISI